MGTGDSGSIHRLTLGRERAPHLPRAQDLVSGGGAGGGASAEPPSGGREGTGGGGRLGPGRPTLTKSWFRYWLTPDRPASSVARSSPGNGVTYLRLLCGGGV